MTNIHSFQKDSLVTINSAGFEHDSLVNISTLDSGRIPAASDLWSSAYHEAVATLGKDIDEGILMSENIAQLFRQLGESNEKATQESSFSRGVKYLQSIQVPLDKFKLALDLAAPLTNIQPATSSAFGLIQGATAVCLLCK